MALIDDLPININREEIAAFCKGHGIGRLSVFGSVLRSDFDPDHSDVDVLVVLRGQVHVYLEIKRTMLLSVSHSLPC